MIIEVMLYDKVFFIFALSILCKHVAESIPSSIHKICFGAKIEKKYFVWFYNL